MQYNNSEYNFKRLIEFHFFNSVAIALCANWVVTDMILLQMKFDLSHFGVVKSSMFLLPALAYWAAAGILKRLNKDRLICLWCYLFRAILPLAIPIAALCTERNELLFFVCLLVFSGGYTLAMFANNSLLTIYKAAFPANEFNRRGLLLNSIPSAVTGIVSFCAIWLLEGATDREFFQLLLILQLITLLADLPGMISVYRVQISEHPVRKSISFTEWVRPFRDAGFRILLGFSFLHALWLGLLSSYLNVYLIMIWRFSPSGIMLLELGLSFVGIGGAFVVGRLADRYGYGMIIAGAALLMMLLNVAWILLPASALILGGYLFICYNGNSGFISSALQKLEGNASVGLPESSESHHYLAVYSMVWSIGCFLGCILAGFLISIVSGEGAEKFRNYFAICSLFSILMSVFAIYGRRINKTGRYNQPMIRKEMIT